MFDANSKQPSNTFRGKRTLETRRCYVQTSFRRSSITGYSPTPRTGDRADAPQNQQCSSVLWEREVKLIVADQWIRTWLEIEQIAPAVGQGVLPP